MNRSSIFFSISITFIALFIFILISFGVLYKESQHREKMFNQQRAMDISHTIRKELRRDRKVTEEIEEYLDLMDFIIIKDKDNILKNEDKKICWSKDRKRVSILSFKLNDRSYIYIKHHRINILLLDNSPIDNFRIYILLVFLAILLAFTLLYLNTIKKLKPLSILKQRVQNIGEENFDIECASHKKDEISQLSNEFDKSVKKLKSLKESRNVFIRNIMHELKTPIAKGQLLTQLQDTKENRESMQKVFYRLESLINEFASIEELVSTKKILSKKEYFLSDIVDNASDLLMNSDENIIKKFEDIKINVDFRLFSIAVKNLIDNAIKYSTDKKVKIKTEGSNIIFENRGDKLIYPLTDYFEPFFKNEKIESNQGFGLGLYIVKHILDANKLEIRYEYDNGVNQFIVKT
ncbi:MAG: ArsS family sensor histidine kinase [Sulfurovum sp.]